VLLKALLSYAHKKGVKKWEDILAIERTIIMPGAIRVGSFPSVWDRSGFDHGGCLRRLGERARSFNEGSRLDGG
jgi:hypothetical protein